MKTLILRFEVGSPYFILVDPASAKFDLYLKAAGKIYLLKNKKNFSHFEGDEIYTSNSLSKKRGVELADHSLLPETLDAASDEAADQASNEEELSPLISDRPESLESTLGSSEPNIPSNKSPESLEISEERPYEIVTLDGTRYCLVSELKKRLITNPALFGNWIEELKRPTDTIRYATPKELKELKRTGCVKLNLAAVKLISYDLYQRILEKLEQCPK